MSRSAAKKRGRDHFDILEGTDRTITGCWVSLSDLRWAVRIERSNDTAGCEQLGLLFVQSIGAHPCESMFLAWYPPLRIIRKQYLGAGHIDFEQLHRLLPLLTRSTSIYSRVKADEIRGVSCGSKRARGQTMSSAKRTQDRPRMKLSVCTWSTTETTKFSAITYPSQTYCQPLLVHEPSK